MSAKQPLVLLHGVMMSGAVWGRMVPLLEDAFEVHTPTLAGHRGGASFAGRVTVAGLVDDLERQLDALRLETSHLVGNSLGAWVALELARRGRARSVCAISPAGFWTAGAPDQASSAGPLKRVRWMTRMSAPFSRLVVRTAAMRRFALRDIAHHGERFTPDEALTATHDLLGCTAAKDLLETSEQIVPLDPLPCPVTFVWPGEDRIFSEAIHGATARSRFPGAAHVALPGTGHVPMIDDPAQCAQLIRSAADRARPSP